MATVGALLPKICDIVSPLSAVFDKAALLELPYTTDAEGVLIVSVGASR